MVPDREKTTDSRPDPTHPTRPDLPAPRLGALAAQSVPSRVVAIGDIHGDIGALRQAFQLAGATNASGEWIGGTLTIVQMGDLIGRSDDERQVLDFIFDLQRKAARAGGTVHALIGNHEVFGGRLDNQAVGPNPFPAWESVPGLRRDDPRLTHLLPHERARGAALMPGGPYARQIAAFPVVLKIRDTVFVHGGVVPRWARTAWSASTSEVRQWLLGKGPEPDSALGVDDGDRVMWTRQFSSNVGCRRLCGAGGVAAAAPGQAHDRRAHGPRGDHGAV